MRRRILWGLAALVLSVLLVSADPAEATRPPTQKISSGDHDIYQICDDAVNSQPTVESSSPNQTSGPASLLGDAPQMESVPSAALLCLSWFADILIR